MTLECTEARAEGGTPSRYTTQKAKPGIPSVHVFFSGRLLNAGSPGVALVHTMIKAFMARLRLVCWPAESKEHIGATGAEEVQQILTKDDSEGSSTIERILSNLHEHFLGQHVCIGAEELLCCMSSGYIGVRPS